MIYLADCPVELINNGQREGNIYFSGEERIFVRVCGC